MNNLASEFQDASRQYIEIEQELTIVMGAQPSQDSKTLAESILKNCDCLAKIEQMNSKILRLSREWKKQRPDLDAESRKKIDGLSDSLRAQIARLNQMCDSRAQMLLAARYNLAKELAELGKGSRYLKSIKPVQNNYPKFIDSMY